MNGLFGTIIGGIFLAFFGLFLMVGILMFLRLVVRVVSRSKTQVTLGMLGIPVWVWLLSSLFNMYYFARLRSEPGADGMMAVGGDFSLLLLIAFLIVFIVRAIRLRGSEPRS